VKSSIHLKECRDYRWHTWCKWNKNGNEASQLDQRNK
jgi:hypothetical protein